MTGGYSHFGEDPLADLADASPLGQVVDAYAAGEQEAVLRLPRNFSIAELAAWHQSVQRCLDSGTDIHIDRGQLESIDAAAIQFLYCLRQTLTVTGRAINWLGHSEPLNETARLMGLEEF